MSRRNLLACVGAAALLFAGCLMYLDAQRPPMRDLPRNAFYYTGPMRGKNGSMGLDPYNPFR